MLLPRAGIVAAASSEAEAASIIPTWSITGISIASGTGRFRTMDGSDNANRSTLGPNAAHYGIWGDGGGFGASGTGIIDAGLPNAGANVRAAIGLARWHGHLDRATLAGWKNAANGLTPPGNNVASSFLGATKNTQSTTSMMHGKSWSPFYIGDVLYWLQSEQPSFESEASRIEEFQNLNLYKSTDHGVTDTKVNAVTWDLRTAPFGFAWLCPAVATAGQCHRARPDEFVYFIARGVPDEAGAAAKESFWASNSQILVRAPVDPTAIEVLANWQVLTAVDGNNVPSWSDNFALKIPVPGDASFLGPANVAHWTCGFEYIPCIDRYLLMRNERPNQPQAVGTTTRLRVYEAPKPWGPWALVATIDPFDPNDSSTASNNYVFSYGLPQGEILQPTWDGSAWKLPVIFAYTGTGANPGYDALGATTAELTLSLTDGSTGLLVDGYQRYLTETPSLVNNIPGARIGSGVGADRMLLVMLAMGNQTPTSVVVDPDGGAPKTMTLLKESTAGTPANSRVCVFGLLDTGLPAAAGTYPIRITNEDVAGAETQVPLVEVWSLRGAYQDLQEVIDSAQIVAVLNGSTATVPAVTAPQKGSLLFSCAIGGEGRGFNLVVNGDVMNRGWLLTFAHNLAAFAGELGAFGMRREIADAPVGQAVTWQTRNLTLGTALSTNRIAAMTFAVRPASAGGPPPPNEAPVVAVPLVDQIATEGQAFSYQFNSGSFTDPNLDTLTFTATLSSGAALPAWLGFTGTTRTFASVTPPAVGDIGTITVRVTATDPGGLSVTDDFTITVEESSGLAPSIIGSLLHTETTTQFPATVTHSHTTVTGTTVMLGVFFGWDNQNTNWVQTAHTWDGVALANVYTEAAFPATADSGGMVGVGKVVAPAIKTANLVATHGGGARSEMGINLQDCSDVTLLASGRVGGDGVTTTGVIDYTPTVANSLILCVLCYSNYPATGARTTSWNADTTELADYSAPGTNLFNEKVVCAIASRAAPTTAPGTFQATWSPGFHTDNVQWASWAVLQCAP